MKRKDLVRIVFIGGRGFGLECIKRLFERKENLIYVFCMVEDVHEKEKFSLKIQKYLNTNKIPYTLGNTVKTDSHINLLRKLKPDLIIVAGWRTIIPKEILKIPRLGVVAAHQSLLPKYRGFAPINWVIINGENETGVTLFYLDEGIDTGKIINQERIKISENDSGLDLYKKAEDVSLNLIFKNLERIKKGKVKGRKQNNRNATYACSRVPADGEISWSWNTKRIFNLIRALCFPYPGAFTTYNGVRVIINKAMIVKKPRKYAGLIPGRVISLTNNSVDVLTVDGIIRILEISVDGEKIVNPRKLINSIKGTFGR